MTTKILTKKDAEDMLRRAETPEEQDVCNHILNLLDEGMMLTTDENENIQLHDDLIIH